MDAPAPAPDLPAPNLLILGPAVAGRVAAIVAALIAVIAHVFLRNPSHVKFIVPLYRRLNRIAGRFTSLMARLAAGKPTTALRPNRKPAERPANPARPILVPTPTDRAWIVRITRHEAAACGSQLTCLLAEPGVAQLLDAVPAARAILRPLCHMLGVRSAVIAPLPRRPRAKPPQPGPPQPEPPRHPSLAPSPCPHLHWPRPSHPKPLLRATRVFAT